MRSRIASLFGRAIQIDKGREFSLPCSQTFTVFFTFRFDAPVFVSEIFVARRIFTILTLSVIR